MDKNNKGLHGFALAALMASVALFPGSGAAEENRLVPGDAPLISAEQFDAAFPTGSIGGAEMDAPLPPRLIPFEQPASSLELTGEDDAITLTFPLTERMRTSGGTLKLAYTNAVSVLPDTAEVQVFVNGKAVGAFPVRSPNGVRVESIPLYAANLVTGRNKVVLRASQHHRVDCSLEATYELWTHLSPTESGFETAAQAHFDAPMDLLTVGKTADGFTNIHLVAAPGRDMSLINQALSAVQALSLALNRKDITVTIGPKPGKGPGIDLYVGSAAQPGQSVFARKVLEARGPGFSIGDAGEAGRAMVVIGGNTPKELDKSLLQVLRGPMREALKTGVLASEPGVIRMKPEGNYTLADAGYESHHFKGRLSRTRFNVEMPADFYPAEYATLNFYLSGVTAPGLLPSSQFLVRVNDRVVTSFPFRNTDGETFNHKRIEMPLRAFRPGVNRVELLAEVPSAADAACKPGERGDNKPRFMLMKESALEVPSLARIGRLPDLGAFSGNAYPYNSGKPFAVMIDKPGDVAVSTALTTVTRLALAAGRPVKAHLIVGQPTEGMQGNVLVIAANMPKSGAPLIEPADMPAEQASTSAPDGAADAEIDAFTTNSITRLDGTFAAGSEELMDTFQQDTTRESGARSFNIRVGDWLNQAVTRFNSWLRYQDAEEGALPEDENTLVSVTQRAAPSGTGVWTTIRAATPEDLSRGFHRLSDPKVWEQLEGGTAIVRADTLDVVTHQADQRFVNELTDESFGNFRRLAAAWFSDNFQIYMLIIITLLGSFGLWMSRMVPKSGVRTDE